MRRSEFVTVPSFSPQAAAGSFTCAKRSVSVSAMTSETTTKGQLASASRDAARVGERGRRIGGHDPQRLDAPVAHGFEHVDGLEAGPLGHPRRVPEGAQEGAVVGILDVEMGGELVGEAADLAPAHGVRLAGYRERAHARPCDAARQRGGS